MHTPPLNRMAPFTTHHSLLGIDTKTAVALHGRRSEWQFAVAWFT